jgi:DNA-binding GntR family transcriptional regulator
VRAFVRGGTIPPEMAASELQSDEGRPAAPTPTPTPTRTVLREQVKELLLERIISGAVRPGERLVETRIAQEFGVSQAPVREALRDLEVLRFVESAPFRGSWVRQVSREEIVQVYPVRAALEEVAARAAAVRLGGRVEPLEREIEGMLEAADRHAQVAHDVRFHELIVEASGNVPLIAVWRSLQVAACTAITALATGLGHEEIARMHEPIVDALRRRDADTAGREIRAHLEHFGTLVEQAG